MLLVCIEFCFLPVPYLDGHLADLNKFIESEC